MSPEELQDRERRERYEHYQRAITKRYQIKPAPNIQTPWEAVDPETIDKACQSIEAAIQHAHPAMATKYYCAAPACHGYPWKASERPHPCQGHNTADGGAVKVNRDPPGVVMITPRDSPLTCHTEHHLFFVDTPLTVVQSHCMGGHSVTVNFMSSLGASGDKRRRISVEFAGQLWELKALLEGALDKIREML